MIKGNLRLMEPKNDFLKIRFFGSVLEIKNVKLVLWYEDNILIKIRVISPVEITGDFRDYFIPEYQETKKICDLNISDKNLSVLTDFEY